MADKLKYSTTQPTLSGLRTDDFVLGTGDGNYGPTSTTSYLNGFTAPEGGYVVYTLGLSNTPIGWVASNDAELIDISRHLGNTTLDIKAAKVYLAGLTDTWVFNSTPNNIVTDSLVFDMDIKNLTSYPDAETNVYDISGKGNDGTLVNGITRNSNGWLLFDGVDDYIEPNNTFSFPGEFTVTCVFKQDTASERSFLGRVEGSTKLIFLSNYNIFFRMIDGGDAVNFPIGYGSSNLGRWNYITATRDGDGVIKASLNGNPYTVNAVRTGTFEPNLIGKNNSGQFWDGGISNMRIYDRSFTETEIKQNYYGGPIVTDGLQVSFDPSNLVSYEPGSEISFSLTGSNIAQMLNGVGYSNSYGGVWIFDGVDDWIETDYGPTLSNTSYAWECWYWDDSPGEFLSNTAIISNYQSSTTPFAQLHINENGDLRYQERNSSGVVGGPITSPNICNGEWHHIVATADSTNMYLYLDGLLLGTATRPGGNVDSGQPIIIGSNHLGRFQSCRMGAVRMYYEKTLTPGEVQQNFEAQRSRFGI